MGVCTSPVRSHRLSNSATPISVMVATRNTSTGSTSSAPGSNTAVRKHLGLTAVVVALVSATSPALAAPDDSPPRTILKARDALQEGQRGDFCWGADEGQVGCTGPLDYEWPPAKRVAAGVRSRIR